MKFMKRKLRHGISRFLFYNILIYSEQFTEAYFCVHRSIIPFFGSFTFLMNDPRSINKTTYTSAGVGAMARFELNKNYIVGQHPERYEDAAQFRVVEADNDESV